MPSASARHRDGRRPVIVAVAVLSVLLTAACGSDRSDSPDTAPTTPSALTAPEPGAAPTDTEAATTDDTEVTTTSTTAAVVDPDTGLDLAGHYEVRIVARYPHDETVFTQGLEFFDGALLESGGGWNDSSLRLFDYETGEDRWRIDLAEEELFAEGLTVVDESALQLTWKSRTLLVTDLSGAAGATPPEPERRLDHYTGEGWGLCYDGDRLVMSDGSATLTFRHPTTFEPIGEVEVTLNGQTVESINELECVGKQVLANIWQANTIIVIDPSTGNVDATIDASDLVPPGLDDSRSEVLNGIAHHRQRGTLWLTGKRWPVLYEIDLIPA